MRVYRSITIPSVLRSWLEANGFVDSGTGGRCRYDRGTLRVYAAIDEVVVVKLGDRPGTSAVAWEVRFPAPEGRLSMPVGVLTAAIQAAL